MISDSIMSNLKQSEAEKIINGIRNGRAINFGLQYFTVGFDRYLDLIDREFLDENIKKGGSEFKFVMGGYGIGKTHFLYCVRDMGWKRNYITCYIELTEKYTPLYDINKVYIAIARAISYPPISDDITSEKEVGIKSLIKRWYIEKYNEFSSESPDNANLITDELKNYAKSLKSYDNGSFKNAIEEAFLALVDKRDEDFDLIIQWLLGEPIPKSYLKRFHIFEKIDKNNTFKMIRSLVQWINEIGYTGVIILLDETEKVISITTKNRDTIVNNMKMLINECVTTNFRNTMCFLAEPDLNWLDGKSAYQALFVRIGTKFDDINYHGVQIDLEKIPLDKYELLIEIGKKLARIYEIAYNVQFKAESLNSVINSLIDPEKIDFVSVNKEGYKRIFIQKIIPKFDHLSKQMR